MSIFYNGDNELRLCHLTLVKKKKYDEFVAEFVRRFRDTKNRCYSLIISVKDLTELALNGLRSHIKEKLEGYGFLTINQVFKELWLKKAEVKSLSLNLIVLVCICYMVILRTIGTVRFMLLNLYGHLAISLALVLL